ncbi:MAG: uracil-DNA glycosylase [Candidatus Bathyarchaeota archaeon]|nr:uracil-DNA glycosylase [Candidatus Bathyarchaeota archaeon]MDH5689590.1 uracil-DNA glycosylase [Candidatus Bathyarchaeota archaeon]
MTNDLGLIELMSVKKAALKALSDRVISCRECPRLINHISMISRDRVRRFRNWCYWGRPLPGFGDPEAKLLIIGLAPAAHGGNRTGRMFTGDSSGDWLIKALCETGFSNQRGSVGTDDGLELISTYITAVVRCAPPRNRPVAEEIRNCSEYLLEEVRLLDKVEMVLTLGRVAFDTYVRYVYPRDSGLKPRFQHGGFYELNGMPTLGTSYHPSRQNTQTGRLTWEMWISIFEKIKRILA